MSPWLLNTYMDGVVRYAGDERNGVYLVGMHG